jgi:integrase
MIPDTVVNLLLQRSQIKIAAATASLWAEGRSMATIRKRVLPSGKIVWQADYADAVGKRRHKQFNTRREADTFLTRARAEVASGMHVPDQEASTVETAWRFLLAALAADGAARSTVEHYRTFWKADVAPHFAKRLLPKVHPADVGDWLEALKANGRTDSTRRRARIVLGAIFDEAIRRRLAHANPVRSLRTRRKTRRAEIQDVDDRVVIPEREEVRTLLEAAGRLDTLWLVARRCSLAGVPSIIVETAQITHPLKALANFRDRHAGAHVESFRPASWLRPFLATLALAGLRIGETRGLSWPRLQPEALQVRDAVDRFNVLGPVKTVAGLRDVPIGPQLAAILADWRRATNAPHELVFASESGTPLTYSNIVNRQLGPLQAALGIMAEGGAPRYTPHSFRHFAISLWIDEGASLKQVSQWAGHDDPAFTARVYAHLFNKGKTDRTAATAGELSVLGHKLDATRAQHGNDNTGENRAVAITYV